MSGPALLGGLLVVGIPIVAGLAWGLSTKGVWFDEVWSKWMVSSVPGLSDAARQRWTQDVHPPLFYLFNYLAAIAIGPGVVAHRWLNLLWLAALVGIGAWLARLRPATRPALCIGLLLLLSNRDLALFAEYRSYALIACSSAALMLLLGEMLARTHGPDGRDLTLPQDRTLAVLLVVVAVLALNLHYIATAIVGTIIGVFALDRLRAGHWRWAVVMLATACIAVLPVLAALWGQRPYMAAAVPNFWVRTSMFAAAKMMGGKLAFSTGLNVALVIALVQVARDPRRRDAQLDPRWRFVALTAAALVLSCALLFVINAVRPVLVPRYLIALSPIIIAALAALAADRIVATRWLFVLFLVNAAVVAAAVLVPVPAKPAWNEGAARLATLVRACPATRLYTMSRVDGLPVPKFAALPNERPFIAWGMDDLGAAYGLTPHFIHPAHPPAPLALAAAPCPTIIWVEHEAGLDGPQSAAAAGLPLVGRLRTEHTRTGTIIILQHPR